MAYSNWDTTAADNNDAAPNGFPEGMPASGYNDSARQLMADLATFRDAVQDGTVFASNEKTVRSALDFTKGADVASATALTLGADGNYFDITGTTTITSIDTWNVGDIAIIQFDGSLALTHHATNLILPGGVNITTAAGDQAAFIEYASGDWRCLWYTRADSQPYNSSSGTFTPTLYGSSVAGSPTLSSAAGNYERISEGLVQIQLRLAWTSLGTAAGDIRIGALPFAAIGQSGTTSGRAILTAARCTGLNLGSGYVLGAFVEANTTYISLVKSNNTSSGTEIVETELSSSGEIYLTGTYQI